MPLPLKPYIHALKYVVLGLILDKIMYLSQRHHLYKTNTLLVNESFFATDYGPLLPKLHKKLSCFGARPIKNIFWAAKPLPEDLSPLVAFALEHYAPMSGGQLVAQTHRVEGAWNKLYIPGAQIPITLEDIQSEISALTH